MLQGSIGTSHLKPVERLECGLLTTCQALKIYFGGLIQGLEPL